MATRKVQMEFSSKNFQSVDSNFDKLTKKEQEAIVKASKLGKTLEQTGNKAAKGAKKGFDAFGGLQNKIIAAASAEKILKTGIRLVNNEYQRQIDLQTKAAGKQETFAAAVGNFRANNQQAIKKDPQLLKDIQSFALAEGAKGGGTPTEVIQALTQVRSLAGQGFTLEQQLSAVKKAIQGKVLDPTAELADIAVANLRVQKSLKVSEREAQNALIAFGPTAGGDINAFVGEFGKLVAVAEAAKTIEERQFGESKTKLSDVLALEGIISQRLGLSAEETTTLVQSVVSKIGGARVGRNQVDFRAENAIDRIGELAQRVLGGEFGTGQERAQVLTSAGLRGSQALALLAAVSQAQPELTAARTSIQGALTTKRDFQRESLEGRTALEIDESAKRASFGSSEAKKIQDEEKGERSRTRTILANLREDEDLGLFSDPLGFLRDIGVSQGLVSREQALGSVRETSERAVRFGDQKVSPYVLGALATVPSLLSASVLFDLTEAINKFARAADATEERKNKTLDTGGQ